MGLTRAAPLRSQKDRPPRLIRHNRGSEEVTVSTEDNKRVVANFVEVCQNQHDLAAADNIFHPEFVNHYAPEGRPIPPTARPAGGFQAFYGMLLHAFPDAIRCLDRSLGSHPVEPGTPRMLHAVLGLPGSSARPFAQVPSPRQIGIRWRAGVVASIGIIREEGRRGCLQVRDAPIARRPRSGT